MRLNDGSRREAQLHRVLERAKAKRFPLPENRQTIARAQAAKSAMFSGRGSFVFGVLAITVLSRAAVPCERRFSFREPAASAPSLTARSLRVQGVEHRALDLVA